MIEEQKDMERLSAWIPGPLKRRIQSKLALEVPRKTLTDLIVELLEQWEAEYDQTQAKAA